MLWRVQRKVWLGWKSDEAVVFAVDFGETFMGGLEGAARLEGRRGSCICG